MDRTQVAKKYLTESEIMARYPEKNIDPFRNALLTEKQLGNYPKILGGVFQKGDRLLSERCRTAWEGIKVKFRSDVCDIENASAMIKMNIIHEIEKNMLSDAVAKQFFLDTLPPVVLKLIGKLPKNFTPTDPDKCSVAEINKEYSIYHTNNIKERLYVVPYCFKPTDSAKAKTVKGYVVLSSSKNTDYLAWEIGYTMRRNGYENVAVCPHHNNPDKKLGLPGDTGEELYMEIRDLTKQIIALMKENTKLKKKDAELKKQNVEIAIQYDLVKTDSIIVNRENAELKKEITKLTDIIWSSNATLAQVRGYLNWTLKN